MSSVLLSVHPESLSFVSGSQTETSLQLNNVGFQSVMFRLKTTAPARYAVKPTKGIMAPNTTVVVHITLKERLDQTTKDEFRLEYAGVTDAELAVSTVDNVAELLAAKSRKDKRKMDIVSSVRVVEKPATPHAGSPVTGKLSAASQSLVLGSPQRQESARAYSAASSAGGGGAAAVPCAPATAAANEALSKTPVEDPSVPVRSPASTQQLSAAMKVETQRAVLQTPQKATDIGALGATSSATTASAPVAIAAPVTQEPRATANSPLPVPPARATPGVATVPAARSGPSLYVLYSVIVLLLAALVVSWVR